MQINYEAYKQKALEAVRDVFVKEYKNSIGIPMPEIEFIMPDEDNYKTGQYYISIDKTWQIHLKFGLLPVSYKDFQEEVRVLTRHEVGHYMCCPFDVLTHFKMLKIIIDTFNNYYVRQYPAMDIVSLAGSLANQAADIIVDTVNFKRHKQETLKSEINWMKKGASFQKMPRHCKLMFLTKETLWKESLDIEEDDEDLLIEVKKVSEKFEENGVENKEKFLEKVETYTHSFFKVFEQDQQEQQKRKQESNSSSNCEHPSFGNPEQQQNDSSNSGQPQASPSKDSNQENGSQFVFQSPNKVRELLADLAQETSIKIFNQILSAAGLNSLSDKEKEKIWFEAQSADMIPIVQETSIGSNDNYSYPTTWKLGDPVEDIDMILTFANSPIFIPGVTTKKWEQNSVFDFGSKKKQRDLLLVIDTSGSMGNLSESSSNIHQAIQASFGLIKFFESTHGQIALIGFSDKITAGIKWTKNYDEIKEELLISGSGGTSFPIQAIQAILERNKNEIVTVIITDGEINNIKQTIDYFKDYLIDGNRLFIFLQNKKAQTTTEYKGLIDLGAKIVIALTAKEMCNSVLNEIYES